MRRFALALALLAGLAPASFAGTYTRPISAILLQSGLAGSLGYTVVAADGVTVLIPRTTAGISEDGTSAIYSASVAGWDESWVGRIKWDAGAGTLAVETFGVNFGASIHQALPSSAPGQAGGLPTVDNGGRVAANVIQWAGTSVGGMPNSGPVTVAGFAQGLTVPLPAAPAGYGGANAATIATAVWQDLLASADFATAGSIGALLRSPTGLDPYSLAVLRGPLTVNPDNTYVFGDVVTGQPRVKWLNKPAPGGRSVLLDTP